MPAIAHKIPSDTLNCLFSSNTFFPRTYYFFHFSQPSKIGLKNRYFVEQIPWVPLSFRTINLMKLFVYKNKKWTGLLAMNVPAKNHNL